jgi:hypothetical protein
MHLCRLTIAVVAIAACASAGSAQTTIILRPVADNTLYETPNGSTSNGSGTAMFAGRNSGATNSIRRGLVLFDIAGSLPAGATILSAELRLFNDAVNASPQPVSLHRVLESWGEGASVAGGASGGGNGAPSLTGDATWLHRSFNSVLWSTPGGAFEGDFSTTAIVEGAGIYSWGTTPQFVSDIQGFLDVPAANFGWLLRGNEAVLSSAKRFATREEPDVSHQPALVITFIPTPATGVLAAGFGALVAARRRR